MTETATMNLTDRGGGSARSHTAELTRQLLVREIAETFKGSSLGLVWLLLNPLLMMALYVVVFGVLFGGRFGHVENESSLAYATGVYIGLTLVGLINETIGKSIFTVQKSANLVKKVVFPLFLLPVVQVLGSTFKFLINACLWLAMAGFVGGALSLYSLYLPLVLLPAFGIALGLGFLISALSVYFRDLQQITGLLTQIIFWSSGVFYSAVKVMEHPQVWAVLRWNPVFLATENIRDVILWSRPPDFAQLGWMYLSSALVLAFGALVFARLRSGFAELI